MLNRFLFRTSLRFLESPSSGVELNGINLESLESVFSAVVWMVVKRWWLAVNKPKCVWKAPGSFCRSFLWTPVWLLTPHFSRLLNRGSRQMAPPEGAACNVCEIEKEQSFTSSRAPRRLLVLKPPLLCALSSFIILTTEMKHSQICSSIWEQQY